jgi:hypothetical protein
MANGEQQMEDSVRLYDFVLSRVGPLQCAFPVYLRNVRAVCHYRKPAALRRIRALRSDGAVPAGPSRLRRADPCGAISIDPQKPAPFLNSIFYGSDLLFSGHTGMPFLAALAFWHTLQLRLF